MRITLAAAGGRNVEVLSPTITRRLPHLGPVDEIDPHIAPVLPGDDVRLHDSSGTAPISPHRVGDDAPTSVVDLRYRPAAQART